VRALRRRSGVSRPLELTAMRTPHQLGDSELSAPKGTERLQTLDRRRPFAAVSTFTSDHTKPRFGHLNPDRHNSFDGNIGFPIICGKRPTFDIDVFGRVMSGRASTFCRRRPSGPPSSWAEDRSPARSPGGRPPVQQTAAPLRVPAGPLPEAGESRPAVAKLKSGSYYRPVPESSSSFRSCRSCHLLKSSSFRSVLSNAGLREAVSPLPRESDVTASGRHF
jgi:hypothetical protein